MFWNIDIKNGIVVFDDISSLAIDDNVVTCVDYLKEDMLQIEFPNELLLDVGWRPSFEIDGQFYITILKAHDWDQPLEIVSVASVLELKKCINDLILKYVT